MDLVKEIKNAEKSRIVSFSLLIIIVSYSLIFSFFFASLVFSLSGVIESIALPSGYLNATVSSSQPEFEISFSVYNKGLYEINDLGVNLEFDLEFYENNTLYTNRVNVFQKSVIIGRILPTVMYEEIIIIELDEFNLTAITFFENNANFSRQINSLLNVDIYGKYFFNLVLFEISLENMELYII